MSAMERMSARGLSNTTASFSGRSSASFCSQTPLLQHITRHSSARLATKRGLICSASLEGNLVRSRFPGFDDDDELTLPKSVVTPESASWGLSVSQMRAMGITSESERRRELDPVRLTSQTVCSYCLRDKAHACDEWNRTSLGSVKFLQPFHGHSVRLSLAFVLSLSNARHRLALTVSPAVIAGLAAGGELLRRGEDHSRAQTGDHHVGRHGGSPGASAAGPAIPAAGRPHLLHRHAGAYPYL